jgi:hypothetical protein
MISIVQIEKKAVNKISRKNQRVGREARSAWDNDVEPQRGGS